MTCILAIEMAGDLSAAVAVPDEAARLGGSNSRMGLVRGESLLVQTLDPGAPVFVNGERIEGEHRLQNNDTLRLGRTTVRLVL